MIRIAIVEDDKACIKQFCSYLEMYKKENNVSFEITIFTDGAKLTSDYKPLYDILLMDIEMPKMDGMTAAQLIRKSDSYVTIIFITNMAQYAIKGYEVDALDYVLKPVSYFAFSMKLTKALRSIKHSKPISILIQNQEGLRKVESDEIIYIEIVDHWLHIHTLDGVFKMLGSLKDMESQLEKQHFVRCNRCYLVNLKHVKYVKADYVILRGELKLQISRPRKKEFQKELMNYYGGGFR